MCRVNITYRGKNYIQNKRALEKMTVDASGPGEKNLPI